MAVRNLVQSVQVFCKRGGDKYKSGDVFIGKWLAYQLQRDFVGSEAGWSEEYIPITDGCYKKIES